MKTRTTYKHICELCGKDFINHHKYQQFCSLTCGWKGRRIVRHKIIPLRAVRYTLNCDNCGKIIIKKEKDIKNRNRHFCSRACTYEYKKKSELGSANPNWKGGISKMIRTYRGAGNKLYKKGKYYERKSRKLLEEEGYYVVTSAGSKGIWDLVAIGEKDIRVIQVKCNSVVSKIEKKRMIEFFCPDNVKREIWIFHQKSNGYLLDVTKL